MGSELLLISHDDLDGYGSNVVLSTLGVRYRAINTSIQGLSDIISELMSCHEIPKQIIMTDLSIPANMLGNFNKWVLENSIDFIMLDHHKTAIFLNDYEWANVVVDDECGTSLLYKHISSNRYKCLDEYVSLVKSYDLWKLPKNQDAHKLNLFFQSISDKDKYVDIMSKHIKSSLRSNFKFSNNMKQTIDKLIDQRESYISDKINKTIIVRSKKLLSMYQNDIELGLIFATQHTSALGNRMLDVLNIDTAFIINLDKMSISLRSKGNMDVSEIASLYSGGGHKNAAGFSIDNWINKEK